MLRDVLIAAGVVILVLSLGSFFGKRNQQAPAWTTIDLQQTPVLKPIPPTPAKF